MEVPPLPPGPPVAFAVLVGSLFGDVIAVAGPPGPPSLSEEPPSTPLIPAAPNKFSVVACDGAASKAKNKVNVSDRRVASPK
jgi:hypothetical protein